MKKLLFLILITLLPLTSMSQDNPYPKLYIAENGDSLILITLEHVQKLNIEHVELLKYKELSDSLNEQIIDYEIVIIKDNELISNLESQLILRDDISLNQDEIIKNLEEKNKKTEKKLKRNVFFNKVGVICIIVLGVLIII
ncbi:hypothetical protein COB55_03835 [Candidatus Wolfebacteria bacterium]|nr:MAG: hypothetical protein COB55_03835 [Candidatus Wolfebacteria bacterium]